MPKDEKNKDLPTKSPDAGTQAREQADQNGSIFASTILRLDDGTTVKIPPNPALRELDDDALAALDRLDFELESYDRHPDRPEVYHPAQKGKDRNGDEIDIPEQTIPAVPGALKYPYRKTIGGKEVLMDPPYDVQQVQITLGAAEYAKLRAGTINGERGSIVHAKAVWRAQNDAIMERKAADSKSAGSTLDLAPVPEADSERPVEVSPPTDS